MFPSSSGCLQHVFKFIPFPRHAKIWLCRLNFPLLLPGCGRMLRHLGSYLYFPFLSVGAMSTSILYGLISLCSSYQRFPTESKVWTCCLFVVDALFRSYVCRRVNAIPFEATDITVAPKLICVMGFNYF